MISQMKALLPHTVEPFAIRLWYAGRPIVKLFFLGRNRYCVLCDSWTRRFLAHGFASRRMIDVVCPVCLSHGRHRLAWLYFQKYPPATNGTATKLLHLAPETALERRLKEIPGLEYLSADIASPHAMIQLDVTNMNLPDASFDLIYCSHVLEHVQDDRAAIREMHRVLKPGGLLLIQTPVWRNPTIEDPSISDPVQRERLFWWHDHVRLYGMDIIERFKAAGFDVQIVFGRELVASEDWQRMGINPNEPIFRCVKGKS